MSCGNLMGVLELSWASPMGVLRFSIGCLGFVSWFSQGFTWIPKTVFKLLESCIRVVSSSLYVQYSPVNIKRRPLVITDTERPPPGICLGGSFLHALSMLSPLYPGFLQASSSLPPGFLQASSSLAHIKLCTRILPSLSLTA